MSVDPGATEIEETDQNQGNTDLSRRAFLTRLTILGIGAAAAVTLGAGGADAAKVVDGAAPDDPLPEFAQLTPGERRRVRRRTRRTVRRVRRRERVRRRVFRRRARRAVRRTRRRVRRGTL